MTDEQRLPPSTATLDASVLAVDDHAVNRQFLHAALSDRVRRLELVDSGKKAIERCRRDRFDLILMDLHMPDLDGVSTWERIRAVTGDGRSPRIIALTADSRPGERERIRRAGFHGFVNKPVRVDTLIEAMRQALLDPDSFVEPEAQRAGPVLLLDQTRAEAACGGPEPAREIQRSLAEELERDAPALDRMLAEGRVEDAAAFLHQWRGASAYAGAGRLQRACERLESSLRQDLDSAPGELYLELLRTLEATRNAIALDVADGCSTSPRPRF